MTLDNNYTEFQIQIINQINWIITETIKLGFNTGSRDGAKVDFLHNQLRLLLLNFLDTNKYDIIIEGKIPGYLKSKDCDLVIVDKELFETENGKTIDELHLEKKGNTLITNGALEVISVKNPLSSYSKNKANYFEGVIGEAVNLTLMGCKYTQFLFISDVIPKYKNYEGKKLFDGMDYIGEGEIDIFKKLKNLKVNNVNILDDFVTFLYHIDRYDEDFTYKEDLVNEDPGISLYTEKIPEIGYSLYLFEYLNGFSKRYSN